MPDVMVQRLDELARKAGMSRNAVILLLLRVVLPEAEKYLVLEEQVLDKRDELD